MGDNPEPQPFGLSSTYALGAEWLAPCESIEDWGCGKGWLRTIVDPERYKGIDGSHSPFADEIADLTEYRSNTPGLFMRHVLEHNFEWEKILSNALASFTQRMVLILFTPLSDHTHDILWEPDPGVPNLSFKLEDITDKMTDVTVDSITQVVTLYDSPKEWDTETVFRLSK